MPHSSGDSEARKIRRPSPTNTILVLVDGLGDKDAIRTLLQRWLKMCGLSWAIRIYSADGHVGESNIERIDHRSDDISL